MITKEAEIINAIIKNRRSIYPYQYEKGKIIPDDIIWQILENANYAPNHKQTEPWRFTVFSGAGLPYLGELQAQLYKTHSGNGFIEAKYRKLLEYPQLSSHVIAIGMKRSQNNKLPEIEEIEATACAVQNMYLTITAYGLGGYWSTSGMTYLEEAKDFFGLESDDKLLGFLHIGYVAKPFLSPLKRGDVKEKVKWVDSPAIIR
jgi:nitroreductase